MQFFNDCAAIFYSTTAEKSVGNIADYQLARLVNYVDCCCFL